ncbi:hypothetical protein L208DRAFT_1409432 [Tricholoma matsutake]|nr:hypothetical protein L208DRAFT_1409432 [Tricholoma matsutake 945]
MHIQKCVTFLLGGIHRPHPFQLLYPSSIDGDRILKGQIIKTAPSHWKRPETSQMRLGELDAPQTHPTRCQMLVKWFRESVRNLSHSMVLYLPSI